MAIEATRIGSYTSWPTGKSQTPQQLAKAGFFYAGSTGLDSLCAHPLMLHGEKGGEVEGGGDLSWLQTVGQGLRGEGGRLMPDYPDYPGTDPNTKMKAYLF